MSQSFNAPSSWTFETKEIASAFNEHVREQLPWYDMATFAVTHLGAHYLPMHGRAYDIGAGNGNIARSFSSVIEDRHIDFVSIESSKEMAKTFTGPGRLIVADACDASYEGADLIVSFLALIFIPVHRRAALVQKMMRSLRPGGALIAVERILPDSAYPSLACARMTMAQKRQQGADPASIFNKEMSLVGLQRPLDRQMFVAGGFQEWFRMGNFAGFVYEAAETL